MTDPEKKKKLEEIKRRRMELQNQLKSGLGKKKEDNAKSVDEVAREALASAKTINPLEASGVVEQTNNFMAMLMKKKFASNLQKCGFYEEFPPSIPEKYEESTQWVDEKNIEDDEEEDTTLNERVDQKPREPMIIPKSKAIKEEKIVYNLQEDTKKYEIITDKEECDQELKKFEEESKDLFIHERKIIERSLNEKSTYYMLNPLSNETNLYEEYLPDSDELIIPLLTFSDEILCSHRTVTSLEFSLKHPELLLAGYSRSNDINTGQKNGLILIWSLALRKEPEFTFTCQPEVTSALFHAYNPKLIVGGTHTGQVLVWDTRGKQAPVYKTPLGLGGGQSGSGFKTHTSEITCLGVIGSTNSSHIISLSNGAICMWSLNNLSKPVKRIELKSQKLDERDKEGLHEIGVMSMGLQQYESNNLLVGSDDNGIYQINLHGDNARNSVVSTFKGHEGPVYSVDYHPQDPHNTCNFSHIFATSSADWTTRLWSKTKPDGPLLTLENSENYVYCSKWCPTNASILACTDGDGCLDIWDFNNSKEQPKIHCKLGNEVLNKLCWTDDGRRMSIGDSSGKINLLSMDKSIWESTEENSKKFEKIISSVKN